MKKILLLLLIVLSTSLSFAQVPQGINYQAVARNSSGNAIASTALTVNFDIYDAGIARRICLTEYKTKFCENPKRKNERLLKKYSKADDLKISKGLLKILIEKYSFMKKHDFKYTEPDCLKSIRNLYLNDNKDVMINLLTDNFENGDSSIDYVKITDIKNIFKTSGIKEKDIVTIKKIVEETFEDIEFKLDSKIDGKRIVKFFMGLKNKN